MNSNQSTLTFVFLIVFTLVFTCQRVQAHETCFYKHGNYGPYYGMVRAEMGERLVIVKPYKESDYWITVRGFICVHEFPFGDPGAKRLRVHRSPEFKIPQEDAWHTFQAIKSIWHENNCWEENNE